MTLTRKGIEDAVLALLEPVVESMGASVRPYAGGLSLSALQEDLQDVPAVRVFFGGRDTKAAGSRATHTMLWAVIVADSSLREHEAVAGGPHVVGCYALLGEVERLLSGANLGPGIGRMVPSREYALGFFGNTAVYVAEYTHGLDSEL